MSRNNMTGTKKRSVRILIFLFVLGVSVGLSTRRSCVRDTANYWELQPELFAPDVITEVLHDRALRQIYVCYNDASYVNVYTEEGDFLWAVSTPYLRNSTFQLLDGTLAIRNYTDAYLYSATDGTFLAHCDADTVLKSSEASESGEFCFSDYQVFRQLPDGALIPVVTRPLWYWLTNFIVCWCVSFVAALGIGLILLLDKRKAWNAAKNRAVIPDGEVRFILRYIQATTAFQALFSVAALISSFFGHGIIFVLFPVIGHFIVYNTEKQKAGRNYHEKQSD